MNVSSDNESSIHSRSTEKILSEDDTSDENQQHLDDSDEDIFSMATQPLRDASTSVSIYDKETQPIVISSPFKMPAEASLKVMISPAKKVEKTQSVSIYDMETQPIECDETDHSAVNQSESEALEASRLHVKVKCLSKETSISKEETISAAEHVQYSQSLFLESSLVTENMQTEQNSPSTSFAEQNMDEAAASSQPPVLQTSPLQCLMDSDSQTPPTSPKISCLRSKRGSINSNPSGLCISSKSDEEETPPSSPVFDLDMSSNLLLNSTHRSEGDPSLFDRTDEEQFVPDTQPEGDEPTQKLFPALIYPSSQSTEEDIEGEVAMSPVLNLQMDHLKSPSADAREFLHNSPIIQLVSESPNRECLWETKEEPYDLSAPTQKLPSESFSEMETQVFEGPANAFAATQKLVIDADSEELAVTRRRPRPESGLSDGPFDAFAATQKLVVSPKSIDEDASPVTSSPKKRRVPEVDSKYLDQSFDAFVATQKLIVNHDSDDEIDGETSSTGAKGDSSSRPVERTPGKSSEAFEPTQKLILNPESDEEDLFRSPRRKKVLQIDSTALDVSTNIFSAMRKLVANRESEVQEKPSSAIQKSDHDSSVEEATTSKGLVEKTCVQKVIIRRSDALSSAGRETDIQSVQSSRDARSKELSVQSEMEAETDTDFEMTFAGSQTSTNDVPVSPEPFRGFGERDVEQSGHCVRQIHQIIHFENKSDGQDDSSHPARFLDFGTDYTEPEPVDERHLKQIQDEEQAPRRSTRKRLPNSRLTDGELFQLEATGTRRTTRSSINVVPVRKTRCSTITLSSTASSASARSSRSRKTAERAADVPDKMAIKTEPVAVKNVELNSPIENVAQPAVIKLEPKTNPDTKGSGRGRRKFKSQPRVEVKSEPGTNPVRTSRSRKSNLSSESTLSAEVKTEPATLEPTPKIGGRRGSQRSSASTDDVKMGGTGRSRGRPKSSTVYESSSETLTDPDVQLLPVPVKRGRSSRVKSESLDQSTRSSVRSRSSSLDTTTSSTRRRKRALAGKVLVMFTGIDDEHDRHTVVQLGGQIVDTSKKCSVLVTNRIRRTVKFLCAVGLGVPIVGPQWLEQSLRHGKFLDPWQHLLDDVDGQRKFDFNLAASLQSASETPFLAGWIFHATPNVLPPPMEMQEIIESCGGFYVDEGIEDKSAADRKVVISCEQDQATWAAWKRKGAFLVNAEAILTGVLRQQFQPDIFKLQP